MDEKKGGCKYIPSGSDRQGRQKRGTNNLLTQRNVAVSRRSVGKLGAFILVVICGGGGGVDELSASSARGGSLFGRGWVESTFRKH